MKYFVLKKYIVTAIIVGFLFFCWYEIRPAIVYSQCEKIVLDKAKEKDLKTNSNDAIVVELYMKLCVWDKGLKE